jgi:hypothetical protein
MFQRAGPHALNTTFVSVRQTGIPARFRPRGCERPLLLVPRSGAAWNYAACRDRPIQDYRQHCATDVDHYVAQ